MIHKFEQTTLVLSERLTLGGSIGAMASGLTGKVADATINNPGVIEKAIMLSDIGVITGIAVGIGGLALQAWVSFDRRKREKELHALNKKEILARIEASRGSHGVEIRS